MSKHISFPAEHISSHEVGKRLRVITKQGAKIEDTLTGLRVLHKADKPNTILLQFKHVPADASYGDGYFEIDAEQMVKRIEDDE